MREIRSSGSVEGVVGNHDSYSDPSSRLNVPGAAQTGAAVGTLSAFISTLSLAVTALTPCPVTALDMHPRRFAGFARNGD